ncbi:MAG: tetratricopeptide repeat protein [Woeseiaceae bacterium]|nr:tetratricopeptide repeat protein [Woeseiaceae bacterium]
MPSVRSAAPRTSKSVLQQTVSLVRRELDAEPGARAELLRVQGTIEMVLGDAPAAEATLEEAYRLINATNSPAVALQVLLDRVEAAGRQSEVEVMRRMVEEAAGLVAGNRFEAGLLARYHLQAGNLLQAEQEHERAIAEFREAVRLMEESGDDDDRFLADAYYEMAYTYSNWRRHEDAIENAQRAVAILEESVNPRTHLLIHPLRQIGFSQLALNNFNAAREPIERAMAVARANFGELHSDVAAVHDTLGALAYRTRRLADAIHHYEEYARILVEIEGDASRNLLIP